MFDIDRVIARINAVSQRVRAAGLPVVLIQHEEDEGPMRHDSDGWQLATTLAAKPGDLRLRKRTPDSFHETELQRLLKERDVDELIVCGLQSDFCVDSTVRRALSLGYPVTLLSDAHSTMDNGVITASQISAHHNATLANVSSFGRGVRLVKADDLVLPA